VEPSTCPWLSDVARVGKPSILGSNQHDPGKGTELRLVKEMSSPTYAAEVDTSTDINRCDCLAHCHKGTSFTWDPMVSCKAAMMYVLIAFGKSGEGKCMIDDRKVAHVAPNDDTEASMGSLLLYLLGGWSELGEEGPLLESQVHRC